MKKNTYTHFPRVNQKANNNLITKKMFLSKKLNMKSLRIAASCFLSSIAAISILGIADKSVAQSEERAFRAVMRINDKESQEQVRFLFIRREPTIVEKVSIKETNLNPNKPVSGYLENAVGQLEYLKTNGESFGYRNNLSPTTVVELSNCREDGWCELKEIVRHHKEPEDIWTVSTYLANSLRNSAEIADQSSAELPKWVASSNFCDVQYDTNDKTDERSSLLDCSEPTRKMVEKIMQKQVRRKFNRLKSE